MWENPETWVAVAFVIFVAAIVFHFKVQRMVATALDSRSEKIAQQFDEARRLREEAQHILAEYQREQRDAKSDAAEIVKFAGEEAQRLSDKAATDLAQALKRREKMAVDRIATAEAAALKEVQQAAVDVAIAAASKVLEGQMTGEAADKLIDQTIRDLPGKLH